MPENPLDGIYADFVATSRKALPKGRRRDLCGPFLLEPTPAFLDSPARIMVFGQETSGWERCDDILGSGDGVGRARRTYRDFDHGAGYGASPFRTFLRSLAAGLGVDRRALLCNNVLKFDHHGKGTDCGPVVSADLRDAALRAQAGVIAREVAVLEVGFCLFLTGPHYDDAIREAFPAAGFRQHAEPFTTRELAAVDLGPGRPPALRTYHPNALRFLGRWNSVLAAVVAALLSAQGGAPPPR